MKQFSDSFIAELSTLFAWRRDVRRFRTDCVPEDIIEACLAAAGQAPSVGLSEPWRFVRVQSQEARAACLANFETANAQALKGYSGDKATLYANLKLSGMQQAPVQLAVFCDDETAKGAGLGAGTMPEMRAYSVVTAVMCMWLAARARGLGMGWVSILNADQVCRDLDVPDGWALTAYLCLGWPERETEMPELEKLGWEERLQVPEVWVR